MYTCTVIIYESKVRKVYIHRKGSGVRGQGQVLTEAAQSSDTRDRETR